MNRFTLLQQLVDKCKFKNYLEIGTHKGDSFFPLKCKYKIAVDPSFRITTKDKMKWIFKNPYNIRNKYFELTSDEFFEKNIDNIDKQDLIFIDGLHTFKASLNDVLNSIQCLKPNGVILMHDCFPPHEVAAMPLNSFKEGGTSNIKGWNGQWCGDVWKTIVYLKKNYDALLEIIVLDTDFGLGLIRLKNTDTVNTSINEISFDEINQLDYHYLMSNPQEIIALNDKSSAKQFLDRI